MQDCTESVYDFKDAIIELRFRELTDFAKQMAQNNKEFATMSDLIGSDGLMDKGMLTSKGLAKLGIYQQQLSQSKQLAAEYRDAMGALNDMYNNGDISLADYNERLYDYQQAQWDAVEATNEARNAILQFRYDAIQAQIDDFNELIEKEKEELQQKKETEEYVDSIAKKQKNINTIQAKLDELSGSDDRRDIALRLQLEKDLAAAREELAKEQSDHEYDNLLDGLDKESAAYEEAKNKELEDLKNDLDKQDQVIEDYLGQVKDEYKTVYGTLTDYGNRYNMDMTDSLTQPWSSATAATQSFTESIADAVSQINIEIDKINISALSSMMEMMNEFSGKSPSGSMELWGGGKWQLDNDQFWYNQDGDYPKNTLAKIDGKTYGFDDEGYMQTGWAQHGNQWYYFDKSKGSSEGSMLKSQWIEDNGHSFYITKDGTMATNAYVKNKDKYCWVNEDGAWTPENDTTTPDLKKYKLAYANGKRRVESNQMAWTNENWQNGQSELITRPGDGAILTPLKPGDGVLKADWSENMFKWANYTPDTFRNQLLQNTDLRNVELVPINNNTPNVNMNIVVQGNADPKTIAIMEKRMKEYCLKELPRDIRKDNMRF